MFKRRNYRTSLKENNKENFILPVSINEDDPIVNNWYNKSLLGSYLRYPYAKGGYFKLPWC